jgi:hypothetical protein
MDGCNLIDSKMFNYTVFKNIGDESNFIWVELDQLETSHVLGKFIKERKISNKLT